MIISDTHKYLFIEIPRTGSTAISHELREKYDGREILMKHSNFKEFLRRAEPHQRDYFVFAGVRHPLDDAVSLYTKFLNNHLGMFTDPAWRLSNGGWVSEKRIKTYEYVQQTRSLEGYLRRYQRLPYTTNANVNKAYCDDCIRFESLGDDFARVLSTLNIGQLGPVATINQTENKGSYTQYFEDGMRRSIERKFGPYMQEWGYGFPDELGGGRPKPGLGAEILYRATKAARSAYMNHVKSGALSSLAMIRERVE